MQNSIAPRIAWLPGRFERRGRASLLAATVAAALAVPAAGNAQPSAATHRMVPQTNAPSNPDTKNPGTKNVRRHPVAPAEAVQAAQDPAPPAAPPLPHWPVNDPAQQASVTWTAQGLSIDARNSSLRQILDSVQSQIGVKIQGMEKDERVFGVYGPGEPREVLSQLLEGTDYNLLMVGNGTNGVPQQILLSEKPAGGPQPNAPVTQGDMYQPPVAPYEPPQPLPQPPRAHPTQPPRTPQQILQEMQQRELMMRQQQIQEQQHQEQEQQDQQQQ
ncbi:MAG: hypothetical protein ACRD25_12560 [Terracidiphilus sp.]